MSEPPELPPRRDSSPETDKSEGRVFPCFECGADLEFSSAVQSLQCPYCKAVQKIEIEEGEQVVERDLEAALEADSDRRRAKAKEDPEDPETPLRKSLNREVQCESCAATVQFEGTLTSLECPYCTTPIQLAGAHQNSEDALPVDGVLPFRINEGQAGDSLKKWISGLWFLPNVLKRRGVSGAYKGVYLPFFTYDAMTGNRYRGERGEHYWVQQGSGDNKRRVRKTRWYSASGQFQRFFDDVLIVAGKGLPNALLTKLQPWPLQNCLPFRQALLAGYLARRYDVPLKEGFRDARKSMEAAIQSEVRQRIGGDDQRVHSVETQWAGLTYKHLLLPVWLLSYRYGKKIYQITINAATGEVQGQRPYSVAKIAAAVAVILAIAGGIYAATR